MGRIVILRMLQRPNQECRLPVHLSSHFWTVFRRGGKLSLNSWENVGGMCVPKYFRAVVVHFRWKLDWRYVSCGYGIPKPIASDLLKFILKLASWPYVWNSFIRLGSDMVGFVRENIRSSA